MSVVFGHDFLSRKVNVGQTQVYIIHMPMYGEWFIIDRCCVRMFDRTETINKQTSTEQNARVDNT